MSRDGKIRILGLTSEMPTLVMLTFQSRGERSRLLRQSHRKPRRRLVCRSY
ncbi:MAG: hypothetical protein J7647_27875 [Cyanobacteria bacterium SBLK]|nr:hypothetical protein [Cyanobacteria bacterium SBLK]